MRRLRHHDQHNDGIPVSSDTTCHSGRLISEMYIYCFMHCDIIAESSSMANDVCQLLMV